MTYLLEKRNLGSLCIKISMALLVLLFPITSGSEEDCKRSDDLLDGELYSLPIDTVLPALGSQLEFFYNFLSENTTLMDYRDMEDIVDYSGDIRGIVACLGVHRECLINAGNYIVENHGGIIGNRDKYPDEIGDCISHIADIRGLKQGDMTYESFLTLGDKGKIEDELMEGLRKELVDDGVEADAIEDMITGFEGDFDAIFRNEGETSLLYDTLLMAYEIEGLLLAETVVDAEDFEAVLKTEVEGTTGRDSDIAIDEAGEDRDGDVFPLERPLGEEEAATGVLQDGDKWDMFLVYLKDMDTYLIGGMVLLLIMVFILFLKAKRLRRALMDVRVKSNTINEALDDIQSSLYEALSQAEKGKKENVKVMEELIGNRVAPLERCLIEFQDRLIMKENISRDKRGKEKFKTEVDEDLIRKYNTISEKLSELQKGLNDALSQTEGGKGEDKKKGDV